MSFNLSITALSATVMLAISSLAVAGDVGSPSSAPGISADQTALLAQREVDIAAAPIHSLSDLNNYLAQVPSAQSPLSALSPGALQRFISSLKFSDGKLGSFSYVDLRRELTPVQAYKVLSLFGAQQVGSVIAFRSGTGVDALITQGPKPQMDYRDYSCDGNHTCHPSSGDICLSSC